LSNILSIIEQNCEQATSHMTVSIDASIKNFVIIKRTK